MPLQLEASQRKSGEAAQAKSRTLRAVKRQVFVPGTRLPVFASASALVMICTRSADRRARASRARAVGPRSEEHTSELQSPCNLVCRLLLEKKKTLLQTQRARRGRRLAVGRAT